MKPPSPSAWSVLFVAAASPGAVFHWLQRCHRAAGGPDEPTPRPSCPGACFLLSDAQPGAAPWRVLTCDHETASGSGDVDPADVLAWMEDVAPPLARAFPPFVTLLWADEERRVWGPRVWAPPPAGANETAGADRSAPAHPIEQRKDEPVPPATLLQRLSGQKPPTASTCARHWALARGLPADRIPALARVPLRPGRIAPLPVYPYETVAGLDARGLLREDGPRLYRFRL